MRRLMWVMVAAVLPAAVAFAEVDKDIQAVRQELASLQIDHALNLTRDQAKALLPLLREAAAEGKAMKAEHEASKPAVLAALTRARDEMRATGTISEGTKEAMKAAHGGPQMRQHMAKLGDIRTKAKQILTPTQIESLHFVHLGLGLGPGMGGHEGHEGIMGEQGGWGGFGGEPEQGAMQGPRGHGGRGFMKHLMLGRIVTSDSFLALVEARAR